MTKKPIRHFRQVVTTSARAGARVCSKSVKPKRRERKMSKGFTWMEKEDMGKVNVRVDGEWKEVQGWRCGMRWGIYQGLMSWMEDKDSGYWSGYMSLRMDGRRIYVEWEGIEKMSEMLIEMYNEIWRVGK